MSMSEAKRDGYYEGYNHALKALSFDPKPKLVATITHPNYVKTYLAAYEKGYEQAKSDRLLLLSGREESRDMEYDAPERLV